MMIKEECKILGEIGGNSNKNINVSRPDTL